MANLYDYLEWRGDLPFEDAPFNEVDNLVLSELSYGDFDEVLDESGEALTIPELRDVYFSLHSRKEVAERKTFTGPVPLLLDPLAESRRFQDTRICWFRNHISNELDVQMAAVTFFLPDNRVYVCFRGSDGSIVGWKENLEFSYMNQTTGQREAAEYMNHLKGGVYPIMVGGHSKGGNFAVYAAAYCDPEIRDMITDVYNNDGPGFTKAITEGEEYGKIRDRIHTFIPESSLVGVLMNSGVEMRIIKSDEKGVAQHDALSWQVMRDHFIESDSRTSESLVFDEAVRSWLSELDDQDRHLFIENVFDVFEETGYETVDDMNANWYKSYPQIIKSLRELPKERQMEITRILLQLAQHYGQAYMNSLSHKEASQDVQKWAREWALKNGKRAIEKRLRDKSGRR